MAIEAVKIPQNVYVEDRIVGPLTLRQVITVALGGGGSYALWSMLLKNFGALDPVTTGLVWLPAVLSLAFAFIRINDLSLMRLLLLRLEQMQKPSLRTWTPRTGISITVRTFTGAETKHRPVSDAEIDAKKQRFTEIADTLASVPVAASPATEPLDSPTPVTLATPGTTGTPQPPAPVDPGLVAVDEATGEPVDGIRARSSMYSPSANG